VSAPGNGAVKIPASVLAAVREAAARAYPHEGCGALLGPGPGVVDAMVPLPNHDTEMPRTRFLVSPADYLAVEEAAEARGRQLLGFWHSHPDHPARPSATDRRYAWEGLLTVIVAVDRGEAGEVTAWELPGPEEPFRRVAIPGE
jgi:proteasome lid subunit RPN8/RPN11